MQQGDVVVVFHDVNGVFAPYEKDLMILTLKVNGYEMVSNSVLASKAITFVFSGTF